MALILINSAFNLSFAIWIMQAFFALVAIVPVIILFGFIEKRLIGGLTAGSVK